MKGGDTFYNIRRHIFGIYPNISILTVAFIDTSGKVHSLKECVIVSPDTPQNRLAIQLKYGK